MNRVMHIEEVELKDSPVRGRAQVTAGLYRRVQYSTYYGMKDDCNQSDCCFCLTLSRTYTYSGIRNI